MPFSAGSFAILALLFGGSWAHMIMQSPVPFGVSTLNNSPLVDAKPGTSSSDYPCKQRQGVYDITTMNNMAVGDAQELNFTGSASHGGGTCQIAVTMDEEPDYKSVFKVIQVFEGGCPTSGDGNDGSHPFSFALPKDFPNGRSTLAWVWYNKIGNREVYMNCAPITVTGGSDDKTVYNSLPNLYLINLPTSECSTVETSDQLVPHPGQYILKDSNTISAATGPSCSASAAAQTSGVQGYQTSVINDGDALSAPANGGGDQTGAPASSDAQATSTASGYASSTAPASGMTTSASSAAAGSSAAGPSASYPTMTVSSGAGIYGPTSAAGSAAAPAATGGACTGSDVHCNESGDQFGLCDNGSIVWQSVAAGTKCVNGQIQKRSSLRNVHVRQHVQNAANGLH